MFIVWGTKRVDTKLGYVADYCFLCRDFKPFTLVRIGMAGHVYFISAGKGELAGHYRECRHCGCRINAATANYTQVIRNPKGEDLPSLIAKTYPNIAAVYAKRLELEGVVKSDPASLDVRTRTQLLAEPFQFMGPVVEKRFGDTHLDATIVVIFAIAIGLSILVANVISQFFSSDVEMMPILVAPVLIAGVIGMIVQSVRAGRLYMRQKIYPVMAAALAPLHPQEAELKEIADHVLKKAKHKGKFKVKELMTFVDHAKYADAGEIRFSPAA